MLREMTQQGLVLQVGRTQRRGNLKLHSMICVTIFYLTADEKLAEM